MASSFYETIDISECTQCSWYVCIGDKKSYKFEYDGDGNKALFNFNDTGNATLLSEYFSKAMKQGDPKRVPKIS